MALPAQFVDFMMGGVQRKAQREETLRLKESRERMDQIREILSRGEGRRETVDALMKVDPAAAQKYGQIQQETARRRALQDMELPSYLRKYEEVFREDPALAIQLQDADLGMQMKENSLTGQRLQMNSQYLMEAVKGIRAGQGKAARLSMKAGGLDVQSLQILPPDPRTGESKFVLNGKQMTGTQFEDQFIIQPKQRYDRDTALLLEAMKGANAIKAAMAKEEKPPTETTPKEGDIKYVLSRIAADPQFNGVFQRMQPEQQAAMAQHVARRTNDLQREDPKTYTNYEDAFRQAWQEALSSDQFKAGEGPLTIPGLGWAVPFTSGAPEWSVKLPEKVSTPEGWGQLKVKDNK